MDENMVNPDDDAPCSNENPPSMSQQGSSYFSFQNTKADYLFFSTFDGSEYLKFR
jgi:hypothetical protein